MIVDLNKNWYMVFIILYKQIPEKAIEHLY